MTGEVRPAGGLAATDAPDASADTVVSAASAATVTSAAQSPSAVRVTIVAGGPAVPLEPLVIDGQSTAGWRRLDPEHAVLEAAGLPHQVLLPGTAPARAGSGEGARREVVVDGWRFEVVVEPAARAELRERASRSSEGAGHSGPTEVRAIIPGVVRSVAVAAGDIVAAGQQLLAVEAMKMQNELRAPRAGTIERVAVGPGRTIEVGDLLVVIA